MPATPTLAEVIRAAIDSRLADVHTAIPGKIKSYDAATQTADVIPLVKASTPMADGGDELEELPVIPNVRVLWPRAGGCYIHFPMAAGDYVLLVFNETAIGHWRAGAGEPAPPGDVSRHSLSYPYAIPGGWPDAGAFGTEGPVIVVADALTVCGEGAAGSAQPVAGATKTDTDFEALKTACTNLATALNVWLGLWAGDPVAPTMTSVYPGVATLITAVGAFSTAVAAVNVQTVGMSKLKASDS